MTKKAVQQIMLGTVTKNEKQARETLKKMKAAGYDAIELNGFMIRPSSFLVRALTKAAGMPVGKGGKLHWKELLEEAGLTCAAIHEDLDTLKERTQTVIQEAHEYGTDKVVLTGMYRFDYSDKEAVEKLIQDLNLAGSRLKEEGIALLYHNHNCEFRKVALGKTAYDMLIEETNPDFVNFELDSYWPAEAGVSPHSLMKKLGARMKLYHINDRGSRVEGTSMTPILKSDSIELGYGNMELEALIRLVLEAGTDAVILESHRNWVNKSPIQSLELSAEFLNTYIK